MPVGLACWFSSGRFCCLFRAKLWICGQSLIAAEAPSCQSTLTFTWGKPKCKTCCSGSLMGVPNCTLCQVGPLHTGACIVGPFCQHHHCMHLQESA